MDAAVTNENFVPLFDAALACLVDVYDIALGWEEAGADEDDTAEPFMEIVTRLRRLGPLMAEWIDPPV